MTLRGSSRSALSAARRQLAEQASTPAAAVAIGDDLFAVVDLLDAEIPLRRALSDPSRPEQAKTDLARALLSGRVGEAAVAVVAGAVRQRWSQPRDLVDGLQALAVDALTIAADLGGVIDGVEDDLFRFGRVLAGSPELRSALTDVALPADRKTAVLDALLAGRTDDITARLVRRAVLTPRGRSLEAVLDGFGAALAARRDRLVALVRAAVELSEEQRDRLAAALESTYGQPVALNVEVDPRVLGGIEVRVGDEVVDATVANRLHEARRRLAG